ncbi:hypothetical protein L1987_37630 [Smallanthus sonchifolius]|uniref:Uncharacterized protein n=1 Tax=Smallanthus sonchifolius TaxID=185202 RepID=A0ACB9HI41_9ASTR|nr:hypothetical protein L1987_37630 [Smallanthus sonchifolius]
MKTYATAWVHSTRKLSTCIDNQGNNNPTWNDKFVFRVNEEFLRDETSGINVEIYSSHWFRDVLVGTVRVLVGNVVPPPRQFYNTYNGRTRCVALQIRRPSGRPQGILNIGVAVLDSSMRSMPLCRQMRGSAVGFRDVMRMDDDEPHCDPSHQSCNIVHEVQNSVVNVRLIGGGTDDDDDGKNISFGRRHESFVLDEWSLDDTELGLQSKFDRWRSSCHRGGSY